MKVEEKWHNELVKVARFAIRGLDIIQLPQNPVIIFDIDNTLLHDDLTLIKPVYMIYLYALMLGIKVIVITNRYGSKHVIDQTQKELTNVGIHDITDIYFRRKEINNPWKFKRSARLNVLQRGYNIVMSVGDQDWDIENSTGGISVKVPIIIGDDVLYASSPNQEDQDLSSKEQEEFLSYPFFDFPSHLQMSSPPIPVPYYQIQEYQLNPQDPNLHHQ